MSTHNLLFFLLLHENICCGYSLEELHRGAFYRTCFSMGHLGVQVSVSLSICLSHAFSRWIFYFTFFQNLENLNA